MQFVQGNFCNLMQTSVSRCKYIFHFGKTCGELVEKNSECIEKAIQSDNPSSLPRVSASPQLKHFHQPSLVLGDCVFPQFPQATRSRGSAALSRSRRRGMNRRFCFWTGRNSRTF